METSCHSSNLNLKYLFEQLITARKEINNLRQQLKSLRYVHERDVNSIKKLLEPCSNNLASLSEESATFDPGSVNTKINEPSTSNNDNEHSLVFKPIGVVSTWFPNKRGTPRQPAVCEKVPGKLTLFKNILTNPEHALQGLEEYSHMWILFHFHKNEPGHVRAKVAPPRLNGLRTGVFSTRSPHRPCPIGLSLVKIIKIEDDIIYFQGVDMVDQTPVLDIKPYIPHYDNPSHIEKMFNSLYTSGIKENDSSSKLIQYSNHCIDNFTESSLEEAKSIDSGENVHYFGQVSISSVNNQSLSHTFSSSSSSTSSLIDVSKDEELALRLQAEEFQENLNFENVYTNIDNSNALATNHFAPIISNRTNLDSIDYDRSDPDVIDDDHNPRNSRLLDGADGPNAVCGADLDLVSRRTLNLRLDDSSSSSSPIRMGIREAPDGEEGFDLPSSQNSLRSNSSSNSCMNSRSQTVARQLNQNTLEESVRIPDWISRPKTSSLSVVFNERSLIQLQEISKDKAEEKKCAVQNVLKEDPRSVYLRQRYGNQFYTFLIHDLHITCKFDDDKKIVTVFQIRHAGRMCECGEPEWQCSGHSSLPVFKQD